MRWLDPDLDDEDWDRRLAEYSAHLDALTPSLPPEIVDLARNARFDLHDAQFVEVAVDVPAETVRLVADAATPEGEWHRLSLFFEGASVLPENFQKIAFALGAEYRATGGFGPTETIIHYQEVDRAADGRFVLRLRLWPFHEFEVWFRGVTSTDRPSARPSRGRRGTLRLIPSPDISER
jgi:hypothetical protein